MNVNYLMYPKMYKTGYLPNTTKLREKQGLMSQEISNACLDIKASDALKCQNNSLYPLELGFTNYGKHGMIKASCPCAQYVRPP